jgi:serine/threonine protein kinase
MRNAQARSHAPILGPKGKGAVEQADDITVDSPEVAAHEPEAEVDILPAGTELGSFRIEELLGVGGMGCVYRARHRLIDRQVALKVLRPEFAANKRTARRFFAEARVANRIPRTRRSRTS